MSPCKGLSRFGSVRFGLSLACRRGIVYCAFSRPRARYIPWYLVPAINIHINSGKWANVRLTTTKTTATITNSIRESHHTRYLAFRIYSCCCSATAYILVAQTTNGERRTAHAWESLTLVRRPSCQASWKHAKKKGTKGRQFANSGVALCLRSSITIITSSTSVHFF